jgi:signal transduction histidine kinase/CheY-like chemotaxis protein
METWKSAESGHSSTDLDVYAMADLVLRTRALPQESTAHPFTDLQIEERIAARTRELREADRLKDQFLAMLSHELRTPLMPALIALDSLQARADLPSDVRELVQLIGRNVRLEAQLVEDMLDLTRVSCGKMRLNRQTIDAHVVLHLALEVCSGEITQKAQHLQLSLEAANATVFADPARLQQIFWNLLENAVKFTPTGGSITIRSSNHDNRLRIEIIDSGEGIDPPLLPRIFDAFKQGVQANAGLGLGLAIARSLVEVHGGTIAAESRGPDSGSTFAVEFPCAAAPEQREEVKSPALPDKNTSAPLRLLLVDDHLDTLRLLARVLQDDGYVVAAAEDVKSALDQLDQQFFDVLISDISLPDGTGYDLMRRAANQKIKGIAMTGFATEEDRKLSEASGFSAHIAKPIDFAKLKQTIDAVAERV